MVVFRPPMITEEEIKAGEAKEIEVKDKMVNYHVELGLKEKKYAKTFNSGEYIKSVDLSDKYEKKKLEIADKKIKLAEHRDYMESLK